MFPRGRRAIDHLQAGRGGAGRLGDVFLLFVLRARGCPKVSKLAEVVGVRPLWGLSGVLRSILGRFVQASEIKGAKTG